MTAPRRGPRPLPLHLAAEGWSLQLALAGLMPLPVGSMSSKSGFAASKLNSLSLQEMLLAQRPFAPLRAVAREAAPNPDATAWPDALDPARFADAVARAAQERLERFIAGVSAYHRHPFERRLAPPPAVWQRGSARLLDYGGDAQSPVVVFIPSLINRAYILDLAADRSLTRAAAQAARVFLLDWGEPGPAERAFDLTDYIAGVLIPALEDVKNRTGRAPHLVGYCMGGTLAIAPAVLRPDLVAGLALLAAPWDFHADSAPVALNALRPMIELVVGAEGAAPVDLLQLLFATLDPTLTGRKFRRFAALDPASDEAQRFVALEDWLNDGVPLAESVARECLFGWYGENTPARNAWRVDNTIIDPRRVVCDSVVYVPSQDRIVPPGSARALAQVLPGAETRAVDLGHIGMIAGRSAPRAVYEPLIGWLARARSR